jgi:hypothetical protein
MSSEGNVTSETFDVEDLKEVNLIVIMKLVKGEKWIIYFCNFTIWKSFMVLTPLFSSKISSNYAAYMHMLI